jgi:hypothetical protein
MTIEKGSEWGFVVDQISGGVTPTGDLAREIGLALHNEDDVTNHPGPWRRLPLDSLVVSLTTSDGAVVRHETSGWLTIGHRYRGDFFVVSSLSFVRGRRIFSRAHPNDGRFDWLCLSRAMPIRQRVGFWRRTRTETHLPHPLAQTGSGTTFERAFVRPVRVSFSDGVTHGRVMEVRVGIRADSSHTHIPAQ